MHFLFLQILHLDPSEDTPPKITNKCCYIFHTICEIFPKIIYIFTLFLRSGYIMHFLFLKISQLDLSQDTLSENNK